MFAPIAIGAAAGGPIGAGIGAGITGLGALAGWLMHRKKKNPLGNTQVNAGGGLEPSGGNAGLGGVGRDFPEDASTDPSSWQKYLPLAAGMGTSILGSVLDSRAQGKANNMNQANAERMFALAEQQRKQQEFYQSILNPGIARGMGIADPNVLGAMKRKLGTTTAAY